MGLFNLGKKGETFLTVVTQEGPGRLRINGIRSTDAESKKRAGAHDRTVCWIEFAKDGKMLDKGLGKAQAAVAERLLRDLPGNAICKGVLERLREGQDSVGKWLQLGEAAS